MSSDIVDSAIDPVVQIQLRDPTPLQGAPQDAKIASTILYLVFQGLQVQPFQLKNFLFAAANCLTRSTGHQLLSSTPLTLPTATLGAAK